MIHYSSTINITGIILWLHLRVNTGVMLLRHRIIGETPHATSNSGDSAQAIAKQLMQRTLSSSKRSKASKLSTSTAVHEEMLLAALARASSDMATASNGHEGILTLFTSILHVLQ
jgi:hypothetical protein